MISIKVDTRATMSALSNSARQIPYAISKGINDIAVGLQKHERSVMESVLDRPTKYTLNSLFVAKGSKANPTATVGLKDVPKHSTHYLEPLIKGGSRHKKGTEIAFGSRWFTPGKAAYELGYIDQHGNFKSSILQQLRSYFGVAEMSAGYTANSKQANKEKLAKMKRTYWDSKAGKMKTVTKRQLVKDPKRGYKTIGGKVYFMSMGRYAEVKDPNSRLWNSRWEQHLAAGIWQKSGVHGADVKPVLMQAKAPTYTKRFDFYGEAQRFVDKQGAAIMSAAVAQALKTAR
ncbi:hypothetical protein FY034_07370 [Trichlorobacter lovleyi]|uniref:hypothetical protein n=1 Tax=Trichlorobacter lovleyi TaxID=313985 RepID=UPI00223FCA23|nr:hypothetical protein [Trichlorobacter lovleyi]QOX78756.1 hypothetical protein FY034_07370 [Trichlorobacter lovleyi]